MVYGDQIGYIGLVLFMKSVEFPSLGDAVAISFTSPLFMALFGVFILGERLTRYDLCSMVFGILVISQPELMFGSNNNETKNT